MNDFIKLIEFLPQRSDRKELGGKAYCFVKQHFSLKNMQIRYRKLYDDTEEDEW